MKKANLVVAVAGKGGVGKTALTALMIKLLVDVKWGSILAIDANPDSNLPNVLGVPVTLTVGTAVNELKKSVGKGEIMPEISKREILEYRIFDILKETSNFDLLVMGRTEGEGCYCLVNDLLTDIIDKISEDYDLTIMDTEAGLEHLSRRTDRDVDAMIIVTDPSVMGFQTAQRMKELAKEVHIEFKKIYLVGNRCGPELESMLKEKADEIGVEFIGRIPYNEDILKYNLIGKPLLDLPEENPALLAVKGILARMGLSGQRGPREVLSKRKLVEKPK